jgi:hypothetical protein
MPVQNSRKNHAQRCAVTTANEQPGGRENMEMDPGSLKKAARISGLWYLLWTITGLYCVIYVPSKIIVQEDAAATANNILSHEFLFRTGVISDLLSTAVTVFLVASLYRLFEQVNERQAKQMAGLLLVQVPVVFVMEAFNVASLLIFKGEILKTFEPAQRQDVAMLFLKINEYGTMTLEMFWGLWLFPLAVLVYRSRFLPRFLGVWLFITGCYYVVLSSTSLMLPQYKDLVLHSPFALPAEVGEVALMLWLLLLGAKPRMSDKRVPAKGER